VISSLDPYESVKSQTAAIDIDLSNIATKADLADLRRELSAEGADLRREIAQLELRLIKWVVGVGITATLAIGGMILTAMQVLLRTFPHT
jgi:hypothetical protein